MKYVWLKTHFTTFIWTFSKSKFAVIIYDIQMLSKNKQEKSKNSTTFKFTLILNE